MDTRDTITAVIVGVYVIGWFFAARIAATMLENDEPSTGPLDRFMAAAVACIGALFWPLAFPILLVMKTRSKTPAELRALLTERDNRIAELENELGIRAKAVT